ncbi:MAG TPA: hypothetical protein VGV18_03105, partial [Verrucomicrobiae bacterium]|nr:hypothetical protein [Verrucomicrobiae bacterium]
EEKGADEERLMTKKLREAHVAPRQRLVHDEDPACKSIWWAIRYALSVPTNIVLIICSAIGYAFFADIRTFGVQYAQAQYHLAHSFAVGLLLPLGIGALCGIRMGGWLGDSLLSRGRLKARVWVAMAFYWLAIILFCAGLYFQMMWLSVILFICSAFSLGAVNPPLDAARLDIIHPRLWGRAEAVRAVLRDAAEAAAPVSFGWLASSLGSQNQGLREAFLIMLIPLAIAGGLGFITFRTYPADAAAASAYREKTVKQASEKKK